MGLLTAYWVLDIIILLITGLVFLYIYFQSKFKFWQNKGVPIPFEPTFPYGHFSGMTTKAFTFLVHNLWKKAGDAKYFGTYFITRPVFFVKDLELVKTVLLKDFSNFQNRGMSANTEKDPLLGHLFFLNGQEWRNLRVKMTPTFTSGKMRMMHSTLIEVGKQLEQIFEENANQPETELKDILARYTTDVISSCAFGIETNSLKNPKAEFRQMGLEVNKPSLRQMVLGIVLLLFPKSMKYIPFRLVPKRISDFFINAVRDTMQYREENKVQRKDFLQLLLELKNKGFVADADNPVKDGDIETQQKFTVEQAAAQAFLFFFAGFETTSATLLYALYELAVNPELQTKLQLEIDQTTEKHNGVINYEAVMEMDLLDRVVSETLRKYPLASVLIRECDSNWTVPGTKVVIEKDTHVWISVYGIHHDPAIYPNPDKFDPDRFLPHVKAARPQQTYLPFGDGPRNCIGNRFALMQIKTGLSILLQRFTVSPSSKTPFPIQFEAGTDMNIPKLHLKITKRAT